MQGVQPAKSAREAVRHRPRPGRALPRRLGLTAGADQCWGSSTGGTGVQWSRELQGTVIQYLAHWTQLGKVSRIRSDHIIWHSTIHISLPANNNNNTTTTKYLITKNHRIYLSIALRRFVCHERRFYECKLVLTIHIILLYVKFRFISFKIIF